MGVQWTITDAVRDVVAGVSAFSSATVKAQKRPFFSSDHGHTLPFVSVCPLKERVDREDMGNIVHMKYPVLVAILHKLGSALENETELQWQLDARQAVSDALWKTTLSGASTVYDSDYEPAPAFDLAGMDRMFDVSLQLFTFTSAQPRSV